MKNIADTKTCIHNNFVVVYAEKECPVCKKAEEISMKLLKIISDDKDTFYAGRECSVAVDLLKYKYIQHDDWVNRQI